MTDPHGTVLEARDGLVIFQLKTRAHGR